MGVTGQVRGERGQTSVEWLAVCASVVAIVLALVGLGPSIAGAIAGAFENAICAVGGGCSSGHPSAGSPGRGSQAPGAPSPGGGASGASPSSPPGPSGSGGAPPGSAGPGGAGISPPCAGVVGATCVPGLGSRLAQTPDSLLARIHQANQALLNSGERTGTPAYEALVQARNDAVSRYLTAKGVASNGLVQALNKLKRVSNPSLDDILRRGEGPAGRAVRAVKPPPEGALATGGGALSKVLKGAGIVGTAYAGYQNVRHDGVGKGMVETASGVLVGGAAAGLVEAACAPLDLTGVGVVACGAAGVAAASFGNAVGTVAGGYVYDHVLVPAYNGAVEPAAKAAYNGVIKPVGKAAYQHVLKPVVELLASLNPF